MAGLGIESTVKFFKPTDGYGFTVDGQFFHASGYRTMRRTWHGAIITDADLEKTPVQGDEIIIHHREQREKGMSITEWSYVSDVLMAIKLFAVCLVIMEETESEPTCDNRMRMYVQSKTVTIRELPVYIGTEDQATQFINENKADLVDSCSLRMKLLSQSPNGIDVHQPRIGLIHSRKHESMLRMS